MSDDPYKAPEANEATQKQSADISSRRLPARQLPWPWIVIGVLGLVAVALALSNGLPPDVIGLGVGLALLLLSAVGLTLNLGAMVPCMFICAGAFMALTNPVSSSHEEAVLKDLGVPLVGAICGAVFGLFLDRRIKEPN